MRSHKIASISLTVWDRAISSKFLTPRIYQEDTIPKFQKMFVSRKMAAILNICIFGKITKLLISPKRCEIERFRRNFQPPRVSQQDTLPKFQNVLVFRKMAAILNFRIFGKITKLRISPKRWEIERFRRNFRPQGYLSKMLCQNF